MDWVPAARAEASPDPILSSCSLGQNATVSAVERLGSFQDDRHPVGVLLTSSSLGRIDAQLRAAGIDIDGSTYRCNSDSLLSSWNRGVSEALGGQRFLRSFSGGARPELDSPLALLSPNREACAHPGENANVEALTQMHCCRQGYLAALPELLEHIQERTPPAPNPAQYPEEVSCRAAFNYGVTLSRDKCQHSNVCYAPIQPCIPIRHLGCFHLGYISEWNVNCHLGQERRAEFIRWAGHSSADQLSRDSGLGLWETEARGLSGARSEGAR
jgi:hypothetical protein